MLTLNEDTCTSSENWVRALLRLELIVTGGRLFNVMDCETAQLETSCESCHQLFLNKQELLQVDGREIGTRSGLVELTSWENGKISNIIAACIAYMERQTGIIQRSFRYDKNESYLRVALDLRGSKNLSVIDIFSYFREAIEIGVLRNAA